MQATQSNRPLLFSQVHNHRSYKQADQRDWNDYNRKGQVNRKKGKVAHGVIVYPLQPLCKG